MAEDEKKGCCGADEVPSFTEHRWITVFVPNEDDAEYVVQFRAYTRHRLEGGKIVCLLNHKARIFKSVLPDDESAAVRSSGASAAPEPPAKGPCGSVDDLGNPCLDNLDCLVNTQIPYCDAGQTECADPPAPIKP